MVAMYSLVCLANALTHALHLSTVTMSGNDGSDTLQLSKDRDDLHRSIQQTQNLAMYSFQAFKDWSRRTTQVCSDLQEKNTNLLQQLSALQAEQTACVRTIAEKDEEITKISRDNKIFR